MSGRNQAEEIVRMFIFFYTKVDLEGTPIPIRDRLFSFDEPLIAPVVARHALYCIDSSFSLNKLLKAWSSRASPCSRWVVISVVPCNEFRVLPKRFIALLTFPNILLRWSSNVNLESNPAQVY